MPEHVHQMYRPPAEAQNVLIRVADGCPHNACAFCAMYRGVQYRVHALQEISATIAHAAEAWPHGRRIFLADGDVLALPFEDLRTIFGMLHSAFPAVSRISCYASGQAIMNKNEAELQMLKAMKLHTLYMGLESGSDAVLAAMHKAERAENMSAAVIKAQRIGLTASVMVLIGLGGQEGSGVHIDATTKILNTMQPRQLSCLRLVPVPGTPLQRWVRNGSFHQVTEAGAVRELRKLIANLDLEHTVFRADHSSNILPVSGRLPKDKTRLLEELDELLQCGVLDERGPGPMPSVL